MAVTRRSSHKEDILVQVANLFARRCPQSRPATSENQAFASPSLTSSLRRCRTRSSQEPTAPLFGVGRRCSRPCPAAALRPPQKHARPRKEHYFSGCAVPFVSASSSRLFIFLLASSASFPCFSPSLPWSSPSFPCFSPSAPICSPIFDWRSPAFDWLSPILDWSSPILDWISPICSDVALVPNFFSSA